MWTLIRKLQKNPTMRFGVPMLVLVVGGSFGLKEFTQIRYDEQKIKRKIDPEVAARLNLQSRENALEEEFEKVKDMDIHSWKNVRGPRPWEETEEE